jgi:hypothetical protein
MDRFTFRGGFLVRFICLLIIAGSYTSEAWSASPLPSKKNGASVAVVVPPPTTATTRKHSSFSSWMTASAVTLLPLLHSSTVLVANAMDGGSNDIPTTLTTSSVVSDVGVLQIPLLAGYCAMALWGLPKAAKSLRQDYSSSSSDPQERK